MGEKEMNLRSIEHVIENNKNIKDALMVLAKDEELIVLEVQKILERLEDLVNDKESDFDIRHAFMTLNRSMQYVLSSMCKDSDDYILERDKAQNTIDNFIKELTDKKDFKDTDISDLRLLMCAAVLTDYVLLRTVWMKR